MEVTHNPETEEEVVENVVVNGACCRTLEEGKRSNTDWAYAEAAKDEDAGKKGAGKGKKK